MSETKEVKIKIPVDFKGIITAKEQLKAFKGVGDIGEVYIPGDWDNWGDSPEKAGCIRPTVERKPDVHDNHYVLKVNLTVGVHKFKPVVISAKSDEDGMAPCTWIVCPKEGVDEYFREAGDMHGNWCVRVL